MIKQITDLNEKDFTLSSSTEYTAFTHSFDDEVTLHALTTIVYDKDTTVAIYINGELFTEVDINTLSNLPDDSFNFGYFSCSNSKNKYALTFTGLNQYVTSVRIDLKRSRNGSESGTYYGTILRYFSRR